MDCKISVIIPCYNVAPYVEKCVESVLAQTFDDYEIILIDDGSTDDTGRICDALQSRGGGLVTVRHFKNQGLSQARNEGIGLARGEYLLFLDSDDYIEPQTLEVCYRKAKEKDYDAVEFGIRTVDLTSGHSWDTQGEPREYASSEEIVSQFMPKFVGFSKDDLRNWYRTGQLWHEKEFASACRFLYRHRTIADNGILFEKGLKLIEDKIFNILFFCYAQKILVIDDLFYNYTIKSSGLMVSSLRNPLTLVDDKTAGVREREKLRRLYKERLGVDIFDTYAGSYVLSALELCVKLGACKFGEGLAGLKRYLDLPEVRRALEEAPLDGAPAKFRLPVLLMKHRMAGLLYRAVWCACHAGIEIRVQG